MPFINANFLKSIVKVYKKENRAVQTRFHIDFLLQIFTVRVFIVIMLMALIGRRKDGAG